MRREGTRADGSLLNEIAVRIEEGSPSDGICRSRVSRKATVAAQVGGASSF